MTLFRVYVGSPHGPHQLQLRCCAFVDFFFKVLQWVYATTFSLLVFIAGESHHKIFTSLLCIIVNLFFLRNCSLREKEQGFLGLH